MTFGQLTLPLFTPSAPDPAPPETGPVPSGLATEASGSVAAPGPDPSVSPPPPADPAAASTAGREPNGALVPTPAAAPSPGGPPRGSTPPAAPPAEADPAPLLLQSQTLPRRQEPASAPDPLAVLPPVHSLEELAAIARACNRCRLRAGCRQVVFGEGNPQARLMFVGEGPGEQEDLQGRPFVGRAGQLLDRMIEAMGLKRQDVYIANVVKCRPPGNRTPQPDEADACWPFLRRQIELINPRFIVCLGATAANRLLGPGHGVSKSRGRLYQWNGRLLAVTFHPAALLRFPSNKKLAWEDLKMVMRAMTEAQQGG